MALLFSTISNFILITYLFATLMISHSVSIQISRSIACEFSVNITPLSTAIFIVSMINLSLSYSNY